MNSEIFYAWRRLTSAVTCQQEEVSISSIASVLPCKFHEMRAAENFVQTVFQFVALTWHPRGFDSDAVRTHCLCGM